MNLSALQKGGLNTSALQKPIQYKPTPLGVGAFGVAKEIPGTLKTLGQDIIRNIGSMGVSIGKLFGGAEEVETPQSLQFLFRDEPIKSVEQRVAEAELKLKDYGQQRQGTVFGDIAGKYPKSLAFAGVMGSVGIDLTPFGGLQKNALKALVKTKTPQQAISMLTKMGIADDLARNFADDVVRVNSTKTAKKLFDNIADLQRTTKKTLNTGALTGKTTTPLATEARLYHGTTDTAASSIRQQGFKPLTPKSGVPLTDDPNIARKFAEARARVDGGKPTVLRIDASTAKLRQPVGELGLKDREFTVFGKEIKELKIIPDTQAVKGVEKKSLKEIFGKKLTVEKGAFKGVPVVDETGKEITKIGENVPAVIQGDTFTLGTGRIIQPTTKELRATQKLQIKATKKEIKAANVAIAKAERLTARKQKIRVDTIDNIDRHTKGNTDKIIERLKKKHLSDEDVANVVLEDGTKLVDTVKVKRNPDKSLASVVTKKQISDLKLGYTGKTPEKWVRKYSVARVGEKTGDLAQIYELPYVYFERKGLSQIYDTIIHEGERAAETMKNVFLKRFKDAGLFKEGGWFTADRFKLSGKEADKIGKYYLSRQKKGYKVSLSDLSTKEKKFVKIFDDIIDETEPKFYEVAKKSGKTPGKVKNYAPIMTRDDIKLADQRGTMDFITRKHPAFFSLKERVKRVPVKLYETDYRKVAARWLDGITRFNTTGDIAPDVKYLLDSDQFKKIVNEKDYETIYEWFKTTLTPQVPKTKAGKSVNFMAMFLRKTAAIASLGLNYASVAKQMLTQIPLTIIGKAPPKFHSKFAKAFGISVKDLPSLTARKGNVAIADLQGKIGRIFTGALTQFDKYNAQLSLNRLLDKEYGKFLKQGVEITPAIQDLIKKKAQDALDLWYGGMVSVGQRPEAFRSELGKFINMFIYPLTSQLNGFYRHILQAKGYKNFQTMAEVAAAATAIAYMEQAITNLSPQWSDEKEMTKDVLMSLAGNIPIAGQIAWSFAMEDDLQVSAGTSGLNTLIRKIRESSKGMAEPGEIGFAIGETFGLPKQFRRTFYEGIEIINKGGIVDKRGKMLAPVKEVDEIMRSILRGKYGSMAAKDWIRNIGEKTENRRWFVPQVEFLQNAGPDGTYGRKAELYKQFTLQEQEELMGYLSEAQQKKLDKALGETKKLPTISGRKSLESIFQTNKTTGRKNLEEIFK